MISPAVFARDCSTKDAQGEGAALVATFAVSGFSSLRFSR
jgi:hypothetical protein